MNQTPSIERPKKNIELPGKHVDIRRVRANTTVLFGSRGSLKTFRGIALYMVDMVYDMPRSTGVIVGLSYEHLEKNTMGPLLAGLEELGFRDGEHYVIDKRPPETWPQPYLRGGIEKYSWVMTWHNGTVVKFISLARTAGANAISAQWGIFDEAKFMKVDKLAEIFPIFRGNAEYFGHQSNYLSKFFATDKLADPAEIDWLLRYREKVDHQRVEDVKTLQVRVDILKAFYNGEETSQKEKQKLKQEIFELEHLLNKARKDLVYVAEINCYDVVSFMGIDWLKSSRQNCRTEYIWNVAYENKDPDRPGDAFYPSFSDVHLYETIGDEDIDYDTPFIISLDYQHSVIPVVVDQISKLPGRSSVSKNTVDYIYSLYPKGLRDAVKAFCDKYSNHRKKRVNYVYDHTAIGKRTDADEYCVIVVNELKRNGWTVIEVYTGQAPGHYQKYIDTDEWLKHKNENDLELRINKTRCPNLIKSIKGAPAKSTNGRTEKDKKYENTTKYPELDQSTTTHGSDAWDMSNDAVLKQKKIKINSEAIPVAFR